MNLQLIKQTIIILLSLVFITINSFGQENVDEKNIEKPNSIIFAPFNLLDPINPSLQLGYERLLSPKWAIQAEVGYIINKGLLNIMFNPDESPDEYSNKGFKLRLELKHIILNKKHFNLYYSFELFYLKNQSDVINQFLVSDTSYSYSFELPEGYQTDPRDIVYDDYFTNDKTKYGTNIKFGIKVFIKSFFVEPYVGIGIANRINKHSNRENIVDESLDDSFLNDNKRGEMIIFNLPINFKIGYRF
jgi:hypothetical protein